MVTGYKEVGAAIARTVALEGVSILVNFASEAAGVSVASHCMQRQWSVTSQAPDFLWLRRIGIANCCHVLLRRTARFDLRSRSRSRSQASARQRREE